MTKLKIRVFLCFTVVLVALSVLTADVSAAQTSKKTKTPKPATASSTKPSDTTAKVDLNTASEKDLDNLPGVGSATAKKIIAGRPYSSVSDLSKAGISAATIKKIAPLVTVSGAAVSAPTKAATTATTKPTATATTTKNATASAPSSQPPSPKPSEPAPASPAKTAAPSTSQGNPGPGMVWVNLDSGIYHYEGSRYYGKTKNGKYISEADAVKAGYHPAKNEKKPQ